MSSNLNLRGRLVLLLLFALVGCRPAGLDSHLPDSFLQRLQAAGEKMNGRSRVRLNAMYYWVGTGGNRKEDLVIVKQAEALRDSSGSIGGQIDTLQQLLAAQQPSAGLTAHAQVRVQALSRSLTGFASQLSRLTKKQWRFSPGLPVGDSLHQPEAHVRESSVGEVRVALSQLRAEVFLAENVALDYLASRLGSLCCFCFMRIAPIAVAASSTVKAGEAYQATLFLAADHRNGWHVWKGAFNGQPLLMVREEARITLPPGQFNPGPKSQWQLDLHLVNRDGRDSILVIRRPYPVIVPASSHPIPTSQP